MTGSKSGGKRRYEMGARAEATAATRERILAASEAAFDELRVDEITLDRVAERAGVSTQTVIRHFESKDGLFVATLGSLAPRMSASREVPPGASPKGAVAVIVDHYEEFGDRVLRALAQEDQLPTLAMVVELGRTIHLDWCRQAFGPGLKGVRGAKLERRLAQLSAVTDIYLWKILRRDRGLGVAATKLAILELVEPLLRPAPKK
jgi:AcrR family transcriptional regulator